ncbi:MAG: hypothetical protein K2I96_25435 [Lachnospiraceae bacterium]|nr:hypothetical protein [Lachnospiraceae bacterium]
MSAYTCLYKAYGDTVDERKTDEITMTLIRKAKPVKLFQYFEEHGIPLENPFKGIYYIPAVIWRRRCTGGTSC